MTPKEIANNAFSYSMIEEGSFQMQCQESGYTPNTTFWSDFSIAEFYGIDAVKNTFKTSLEEWKTNAVYLTELVLVLNWKIWEWSNRKNDELGMLYNELYEKADTFAIDNLTGEDLDYFYSTTD